MKPPYIINKYQLTVPDVIGFCKNLKLSENEFEFITRVLAETRNHTPLSSSFLADSEGITIAGIRKRLEKYKTLGVFEETKIKVDNVKKPVSQYSFTCVEPADSKEVDTYVSEDEIKNNYMPITNASLPSLPDDLHIDDLFLTTLFTCLKYYIPRAEEAPQVKHINMFNAWIEVTVRTTQGMPGASILDTGYLIVIYSICYQIIKESMKYGENPQNNFIIDVKDINTLMEMSTQGGDIKTTLNALSRISNTIFFIKRLPIFFQQRWDFKADSNLQMINNLTTIYQKRTQSHKKTFVSFQLPHFVFVKMCVAPHDFYLINKNIVTERNSALLALHLYLKRVMGQRLKSEAFNVDDIYTDLSLVIKIDRFIKDLTEGLLKLALEIDNSVVAYVDKGQTIDSLPEEIDTSVVYEHNGENEPVLLRVAANVYGYVCSFEVKDRLLRVSVKIDDPILGLDSKHRRALRKKREKKGVQSEMFK